MRQSIYPNLEQRLYNWLGQKERSLEEVAEYLGLDAEGAQAWLARSLGGRFAVASDHISLWSWQLPFPPKDETIVALDLEMTGGHPERDAIIEVGAVRLDAKGSSAWSSLVSTEVRLPSAVQELTGITGEMCLDAPSLEEVLEILLDFCFGATLLIHDVRNDLAFLAPAFARLGRKLDRPIVDTLTLSRRVLLGRRYSLAHLARIFDVAHRAHRALDDAQATLDVGRHLYFSLIQGDAKPYATFAHRNVLEEARL